MAKARKRQDPTVYFLIVVAKPEPDSFEEEAFGGASVVCWIRCDTLKEAKAIATEYIENEGWTVDGYEVAELATRSVYIEETAALYDQALKEGEVFDFQLWNVDDHDPWDDDDDDW